MRVSEARAAYVGWLTASRDLSAHTIRAYECDVSALEEYLGEKARVGHISREVVMAFFEEQRAEGLSPRTVRRRASGVRGFSRWLVSRRLLGEDPTAELTVAPGRSRRLPRIVPAQELERLLSLLRAAARVGDARELRDVSNHPHEATTLLAVTLMLVTGVRVHEVVGIRCDGIDLAGRSLILLGKGRRERRVFLPDDWVVGLTRAYMRTREALEIGSPQLLFNSRYEALSPAAMRGRLMKAAEVAGLQSRVTPHMLRHTAATQLIEAGVDIRYIQRLLGHASLSTTEIYTHVSDRTLQRVVSDANVLGRMLQDR